MNEFLIFIITVGKLSKGISLIAQGIPPTFAQI